MYITYVHRIVLPFTTLNLHIILLDNCITKYDFQTTTLIRFVIIIQETLFRPHPHPHCHIIKLMCNNTI